MKIEVDKIITLNNKERYVVLEKVNKDNIDYYYIAQVNEDETDIKDVYKVIKTSEKNGIIYIIEITDENELNQLLPLFIEKMPS